jgi:hypothetical protein
MMRRFWPLLALGGVLAVAGCSNDKEQNPTAPELKVVPAPYPGCDFNTVKNLINSYFTSPNQQTAQGYESVMDTASNSLVRREYGFKIIDLIGQVSRSSSPGSTTTGSSLTKAVTKCMFDTSQPAYTSLANGAGIDGVAFDKALSPTTGGVYYVVGAGYDITTADFPNVLKGTVGGTYSGNGNYKVSGGTRKSAVGPAVLSGTTYVLGNSWTTNLSGNTYEGGRALVYGYQTSTGTDPLAYEWATIDPLTTFEPYALVSICEGTNTTLMVHETGVGVLAFSAADLCDVVNYPDATGTATGFRSKFSNASVASVHLEWITPPPAKMKVDKPYTAIARATTLVNGVTTGVNGACLILSASNNNGQPLTLTGTNECDGPSSTQLAALTKSDPATNQAGYATYSVTVTKSGGVIFTLSGFEVVGRSGTFENTVQTKTNVVP